MRLDLSLGLRASRAAAIAGLRASAVLALAALAPARASALQPAEAAPLEAASPAPAPPGVSAAAPPAAAPAGVVLHDGTRVAGRVVAQAPGAYVIVEREDGQKEAVEWGRIAQIDGRPPPPVPSPGAGTLIPPGFTPDRVQKLSEAGKSFSELAPGLVAPRDGQTLVGSIRGTQDVLEQIGLKRGPPNGLFVGWPLTMMPLCFEMSRGTLGRVDGTGGFGAGCKYVIMPLSVLLLVASPFFADSVPEMQGPSVHHVDAAIYALDYSKKSALTGAFGRQPSGSFLGNNLGYDLGYTYIHRRYGVIGYGHLTLQQTSVASTDYVQVSSSFFKGDAQVGLDFIRLLSGGSKKSYWSQHTAYVRGGPSLFHNWILSRDVSGPGRGASIDNPLNNSIPLVTGLGYELAAELDFRFPWSLGGLHFKVERGSYPSLSFPDINARDGAFVALIGFDDLRAGDTYTWQRLKLELELPIDYSRAGGIFLGGQIAKYENNFGSGVDNRGISLDYRFRFQ